MVIIFPKILIPYLKPRNLANSQVGSLWFLYLKSKDPGELLN